MQPDARLSDTMTRVWDPLVRLFHWSMVIGFAVAWLTPKASEAIHTWAGLAAAGLICLRLIWGIAGPRYAAFSQFVRGPRTVLGYLRAITLGTEARYIGHNPAGGAMVVALLTGIAITALSGWMQTTDMWFGIPWVEDVHSLAAHAVLGLVVAHVGGVAVASYRHRENLVRAMVTGRKRPPTDGDVS